MNRSSALRRQAARSISPIRPDRLDHPVDPVDDVPGPAVLDDLRHAGPAEADDRRARRERLDHHQPERLVPLDREEEGVGAGEQVALRLAADLADGPDPVAVEPRLDRGPDVAQVVRVDLAREDEPPAGPPGRLDRPVGALRRAEPAEEQEIALVVARPPHAGPDVRADGVDVDPVEDRRQRAALGKVAALAAETAWWNHG